MKKIIVYLSPCTLHNDVTVHGVVIVYLEVDVFKRNNRNGGNFYFNGTRLV